MLGATMLDIMVNPPTHLVMPEAWHYWLTLVFLACGAGSWVYGISISIKEKDIVPLLVIAGGSLAVVGEAAIDVLGLCYWTEQGQWTLYEAFDRKIPVLALGSYTFFFGGVVLFTIRQFERGLPAKRLVISFFAWMLMEWTWEPIPIHYGMWSYYGAQPFRVFDFPLWWPPVNTVGAYAAALLILKLKGNLTGVSKLAIIPLVLSGDLMGNALVAWPLWVTLNMDVGYIVTVPAGILTLLLCAIALKHIVKIGCGSSASAKDAGSGRRVAPSQASAL